MGYYTVVTLSGSAGKSTSVSSIGVLAAKRTQKKIRLIDFDAQGNLTNWFGIELRPGQATIAEVIQEKASLAEASIDIDEVPGLSIVPVHRDSFDEVNVHITREVGAELDFYDILRRSEDDTDHTMIDCAGSLSAAVIAAILAAAAEADDPDADSRSGVITCTQPMLKENQGIPDLEKQLAKINRRYRHSIELLAIVPCIVPHGGAGDVYAEQLEDLVEVYEDKVTPPARRTSAVPLAYSHGTPLPLYGAKGRPITNDYAAVLDHLQEAGCLL